MLVEWPREVRARAADAAVGLVRLDVRARVPVDERGDVGGFGEEGLGVMDVRARAKDAAVGFVRLDVRARGPVEDRGDEGERGLGAMAGWSCVDDVDWAGVELG